jgi:hypothetical protein
MRNKGATAIISGIFHQSFTTVSARAP